MSMAYNVLLKQYDVKNLIQQFYYVYYVFHVQILASSTIAQIDGV